MAKNRNAQEIAARRGLIGFLIVLVLLVGLVVLYSWAGSTTATSDRPEAPGPMR